MFPFTLDAVHQKNVDFAKSWIDLKVTGYKAFAEAFNAYTNQYFQRQINESAELVETAGVNMKKVLEVKHG